MKIKELKDFLSTVIPSNDILVKSNVQLYDGHKTYDVESMNYAHAISGGVESEILYLTVTRAHDKSKDEWKYPSKDELPKENTYCIVTLEHLRGKGERFISTAWYSPPEYDGWGGFKRDFYKVVAWMPAPEPAKEEV